ncbi:hypothetical protein CN934_29560 [Ensifer sp. MMN_5]|nr:hypothetical protein CN934_29560 [Ensifer sp. MMN_5]PND24210.1 hypothetical protein CN933_28940 [Sinorhizobium sp. M4_45]RVP96151.1 hypothetical protein CN070_26280 [Sinorhizobium meliloti]
MNALKRTPWREAALDIVVSQTIALGEMSSLFEALHEEQKHAGGTDGRVLRDTCRPLRIRP